MSLARPPEEAQHRHTQCEALQLAGQRAAGRRELSQ